MERNDPLLCVSHCDSSASIVCLKVPSICPLCSKNLTSAKIPPFRLPTPFTNSNLSPLHLVIKPTNGTFLNDYNNTCDLHIGVTDSRGVIYSFNTTGIERSTDGWSQCVTIDILPPSNSRLKTLWDTKLQECASHHQWNRQNYNEDTFNCFDFVLTFLRLLGLEYLKPSVTDRESFCDEVIAPHTRLVTRYVGLYRKVIEQGLVVQKENSATML